MLRVSSKVVPFPAAFPPAEPTHRGLIARLRRQIVDALAPLAPAGRFALVDFPAQGSVGDAAIWLGTVQFMREVYGADPAYVAQAQDFDANACHDAIGDGPIFINGGGNFGDLWPTHQVFLRELLVTFPDRPVIQLPQSIHFRDPRNLAATARAIAGHDRFHLFVRDRASLALARRFDCASRLCCDLSIWLGPQARPRPPGVDVLCLLREDRERALATAVAPVAGRRDVTDWAAESLPVVRSRRLLAIAGAAVRGRLDRNELRRVSFEAVARARVQRGLRLVARGRALVTDRLHAHLFAVLLGLPHAVLDNSYGKVHAFVDCWTRNCPQFAAPTEPEQAVQWAEEAATAAGHEATG